MSKNLETILDLCIDDLKKGKSIEDCLKQHPRYSTVLKPLLSLVNNLYEAPVPEPKKNSINLTLLKIGEIAALEKKKTATTTSYKRPLFRFTPFRHAFAEVLAITLIIIVLLWTIKLISAESLFGELLYPVKLSTEKLKFSLASKPESKAVLRIAFSDARLDELIKTIEKDGTFDKSLLKALLKEAALALVEIETVQDHRFALFLPKINSLNSCQQATLRQLSHLVSEKHSELLDKAIVICNNRQAWLSHLMVNPKNSEIKCRYWGPGCLCNGIL